MIRKSSSRVPSGTLQGLIITACHKTSLFVDFRETALTIDHGLGFGLAFDKGFYYYVFGIGLVLEGLQFVFTLNLTLLDLFLHPPNTIPIAFMMTRI